MEKRNNSSKKTDPIDKKEEVQKSKDEHIDQDFENYPHPPAKENIIHPETDEDSRIAASGDEKEFTHIKPEEEKGNADNRITHTGSGGAFEATEEVDHDNDEDNLEKNSLQD
jgi:hypothetical protein